MTTAHQVQTTTSPSFLTTTPNPFLQPAPEPSREPTLIPSSNLTTPSLTPPPQVVGQPVIDITTEQTTTRNGSRIAQGPGATSEVTFNDPSASLRGTCTASVSPVDFIFVESSV